MNRTGIAALLGLAALSPVAGAAPAGPDRTVFGTTADGQAVDRYVLRNAHGTRVGVLTLGGVIDEISVPDRSGHRANVVLALPDVAGYEASPTVGAVIGRYANRISHGGFSIDGVHYPLSPDPTAIVSHGGKKGFGAQVWKAEPCRTAGCASLTLRYHSADGENGFPGAMDVAVTYTLTADDAVRLDYVATTSKPTVVNLTNHSYFNLGGDRIGSVDDQWIQIVASRFTAVDAVRNATGEIRPVAGTALDLRALTRIGARVASNDPQILLGNGFDHNFVLDKPAGDPIPVGARAYDPGSGRTLEMRTTQPGVQFYTGNFFNGKQAARGGRMLRQGAGFALETQHYPDSPNQPAFPTTILRPGETFRSTTIFRFGVRR
ncbi:MAG: galactose mutarotase [Sphingomonas bacterium]|uniref:aldose epimerase family protein n=1 Tax=Sphingomonas bacterium TaxID=1895847 RepID=UPI0026310D6B|nr:aldose epimerase family protein [Sphingomonas bacterium]MDB5706723.1 galactose mutarotase [Sphingomonas bacterium]